MKINENKSSNLIIKTSSGEVISCEDIDKFTVGMEINSQWELVPMRNYYATTGVKCTIYR